MRRIVLDVGVVVSGLLSAEGPPGRLLDAWRDGLLDLVVCPLWLAELERVLGRPKIGKYVTADDAADVVAAIVVQAELVDDPQVEAGVTPDPGDDYLVALARAARADYLVSGDAHLTGLSDPDPPVLTPRQLLELVDV